MPTRLVAILFALSFAVMSCKQAPKGSEGQGCREDNSCDPGLVCWAGTCKTDQSDRVAKLAERACACKDAACGNKVLNEFIQLLKGDMVGDLTRIEKESEKVGECLVKAGVDANELLRRVDEAM